MEGEYIAELRPSLNHRLAGRKSKEWFNVPENQERKKKMDKEYYYNHKEKQQEEKKAKYQERREEILENLRQRVQCEICKKEMSKGYLNKHIRIMHS